LTKAGFDAKADIALTAFRDAIRGTGSKTLTDLATALTPLATSAKQAEAIAALGAIANAAVTDPAANGTAIALLKGLLSRIQTLENKIDSITDGTSPATVQLSGSITSVSSPPVVGTKTIIATAAEIFAGASVKANRRKLIIRNEDPVLRMRIGPSSVTQQNGYPIEPGATVNIQFDPATAVAIYGISEGAALSAAILEV
ncbi:MAG: hypothetical protein QM216_04135, partial [Bacillota bacterium]|nr:hypothetical protein [Bacillota bacterium]